MADVCYQNHFAGVDCTSTVGLNDVNCRNYNYALALYSTSQIKAANQALNRAIKTGYSGSPRFKQLLESKIKPVAQ